MHNPELREEHNPMRQPEPQPVGSLEGEFGVGGIQRFAPAPRFDCLSDRVCLTLLPWKG